MGKTDDLISIKQFAALAGRSQQTIYKQVGTRLAPYVHEKDGQKYIERRALDEVFKMGDVQPDQSENNPNSENENNVEQRLYSSMQTTIDVLQEQIRNLQEQIRVKDQQIESLNERLREALEISRGQLIITAAGKQLPEATPEREQNDQKKQSIWNRFRKQK